VRSACATASSGATASTSPPTAGKTFVNVGLKETHHIGRVITHPTNPDIVYVAAQGHLWGYNDERGIFKTIDGGKTWRKLAGGLPTDNRTGASEIQMDPSNPGILYAGMWERIRRPYIFESGGPNGGIYKSTNGGDSWTKLTSGLPTGRLGKVTITIHRKNPRILSAIVEATVSRDLKTPGSGIYRSEDAGATWTYVNTGNDRPMYYSHIYLDPNDANRLYALTVPARVSEDGGRTFTRNLNGIEGDFHTMWIDPNNSDRFYIGNDKGASVTYDRGNRFIMFDNMDIGQFYAVTADNRDPYFLYGGLQDSGNWGGPSNSRDYNGILGDHWFKFHSGDGFHTTVDPDDWRIVYTETQNGGLRRLDAEFRQTGSSVSPRQPTILNFADVSQLEGKAPTIRYNWSAPLILSPHDSKTLYIGGNYLLKSTDRGESWTIISPDLSTKDPDFTTPAPPGFMGERGGAENHATLISVVESPVRPGIIWGGTDDGNVQVTRDGGATWTNVRPNIPATEVPQRTWVSRVEPSHFDAGTAYVSFDGHRSDNFKRTSTETADFGKTWTKITANLPANEPVYVVKEDLKNPSLLFVGTERGVYASIDGGARWDPLNTGLPRWSRCTISSSIRATATLIAATHGRSLWILDDITPLQQLTPAVLTSDRYGVRQPDRDGVESNQPRCDPRPLAVPRAQSVDHRTAAAAQLADRVAELGDGDVLRRQGDHRAGEDRDRVERRRADVHRRRAGDPRHQSLFLDAAVHATCRRGGSGGWRRRTGRRPWRSRWRRRRRSRWWRRTRSATRRRPSLVAVAVRPPEPGLTGSRSRSATRF
jgi:photosystem II stability/assembly factor-like uncharacterized protein